MGTATTAVALTEWRFASEGFQDKLEALRHAYRCARGVHMIKLCGLVREGVKLFASKDDIDAIQSPDCSTVQT